MSYSEPTASYHIPVLQDDEPPIVYGQWEFGIWESPDLVPNGWMALCCPCVSIAQIAHRIHYMTYWKALVLFGLINASFWPVPYLFFFNRDTPVPADTTVQDVHFEWGDDGTVIIDDLAPVIIAIVVHVVCYYIQMALVVKMRKRIRATLAIPDPTCRHLRDSHVVFRRHCCSLMQMAAQVKSYDPKSCDFRPRAVLPAFALVP